MQAIEAIRNQFDRSDQTRALSKAIDVAVTKSVKGFSSDVADQGVDLAARIVADRGLSAADIARMDFDGTRAADRVLAASACRDWGWAGGEPACRAAAEAAIRATYRVLADQARLVEHAQMRSRFSA